MCHGPSSRRIDAKRFASPSKLPESGANDPPCAAFTRSGVASHRSTREPFSRSTTSKANRSGPCASSLTTARAFCPSTPIIIETISGFARNFPYKKPEFWQHYDQRPEALSKFEALTKRGWEIKPFKAPEGVDRKKAEQDYQKGELERSIAFLRTKIGLGLKV